MSIEVNGHKLPPLLVKLIEEGKWGNRQNLPPPALNKILEKAGLPPIELELAMLMYSVENMKAGTIQAAWPHILDAEERLKIFEIYYQASSKELGHEIEDEGILDIDKAVFVAANSYGEVICLDYRDTPDNPCLRGFFDAPSILDWTVIAPDFESFARELGLVE